MSDRSDTPAEAYSPHRRTALVLTGTGTAGAYHAGVVRALHESGVKLDLVAGRGVGVIGALFVALDGAHRLWDDKSFWRAPVVRKFYAWRLAPRVAAWALAVALTLVAVPIAAVALGLLVFPIDFIVKMTGLGGASGLVGLYLRATARAFAPTALPTWLPRLVLLVLGVAAAGAFALGASRRHTGGRGAFWWRVARAPLSGREIVDESWRVLWDLAGGAAQVKRPPVEEIGQRYAELLAENIGQPGFRELVITAHDLDARRDLVFALVGENRRPGLVRRPTSEAAETRRAEVLDLAGADRERLTDAVAGALTIPMATEWRRITFAPDSYWRGETHRLCDRPASLIRLIDELIDLEVEQVILVSAAPDAAAPHALAAPRLDARGGLGEYVASADSAIVRDATTTTGGVRIFTIRPAHNPVGPFDFDGGYDDRSRRRQALDELIDRGYADAYHQFVEPVVGASGERVAHSHGSGRL